MPLVKLNSFLNAIGQTEVISVCHWSMVWDPARPCCDLCQCQRHGQYWFTDYWGLTQSYIYCIYSFHLIDNTVLSLGINWIRIGILEAFTKVAIVLFFHYYYYFLTAIKYGINGISAAVAQMTTIRPWQNEQCCDFTSLCFLMSKKAESWNHQFNQKITWKGMQSFRPVWFI